MYTAFLLKTYAMKKYALPFTILAALFLSSCLVSSLNPFYTEKDITYIPGLLGSWHDQDSCIWVVEQYQQGTSFMGPTTPTNYYRISYYEKNKDAYKKSIFKLVLFSLKDMQFIDFYPEEYELETDLASYHVLPVHTLARFSMEGENIVFKWYNDEWLSSLFEKNRLRIQHETIPISPEYKRQVLTASTEELQKFLLKYGNDANAFKPGENDLTFKDGEEYDYTFVLKRYDGKIPE